MIIKIGIQIWQDETPHVKNQNWESSPTCLVSPHQVVTSCCNALTLEWEPQGFVKTKRPVIFSRLVWGLRTNRVCEEWRRRGEVCYYHLVWNFCLHQLERLSSEGMRTNGICEITKYPLWGQNLPKSWGRRTIRKLSQHSGTLFLRNLPNFWGIITYTDLLCWDFATTVLTRYPDFCRTHWVPT